MVKVDNIMMAVAERRMAMGMTVRFLPLPALVNMLMMLIVDMQVLVFHRRVHVLGLAGTMRRP